MLPQGRINNSSVVVLKFRALMIVTFNRADFLPAATRHGIMILSAGEALKRIATI